MGKRYDLAIFDMDGTLTKVKSSWNHILTEFGGDNTDGYNAFMNGDIDEDEFMRSDIALWKKAKPDVSIKDVARMMRSLPLVDGIQETVAALHYNGMKCVICSGGLSIAAKMIADEFGFDAYMADDLEADEDGLLTGNGIRNVDLRDKGASARVLMERFGAEPERCIAVGNSYGDVPMFDLCGLSIAFNPIDMEFTGASADHVVVSGNISEILDVILEVKDRVPLGCELPVDPDDVPRLGRTVLHQLVAGLYRVDEAVHVLQR